MIYERNNVTVELWCDNYGENTAVENTGFPHFILGYGSTKTR